jgi:GGDEF domain-containing protein
VIILCGMTAMASLACLVLFFWPLSPNAPVRLDLVFFGLSAALTIALWTARRVPRLALHGMVITWLIGITLGVLFAPSPQSAAGTGVTYTWTLLYTSYFFSERAARAYAATTAAVYLAASLARPYQGVVATWAIVTITCVVGCELLLSMLRQLRVAALHDNLTGQRNRAALVQQGADAIRNGRRRERPLTVALLDLDHFKQINDERGHAAGDAVLQHVAQHWTSRLRVGDTLYRSGGDEFVLLLPDTREDQAAGLLNRLRDGSPTAWCFGLAEVGADDDLDDALARADRRLYAAKSVRPPAPLPAPREPHGSEQGSRVNLT